MVGAEAILKNHLNEIIRNAYYDADEELMERYLGFRLYVEDKSLRSYSGIYYCQSKTIKIFDIDASPSNNISTLLHEVAYHIDFVQHGKSGHQKPFYDAFRKLLYSALDLGKVQLDDIQALKHRNTDYNKVLKMLREYQRSPAHIDLESREMKTVKVLNGFEVRENLKGMGMKWNHVEMVWEMTVDCDVLDGVIDALADLDVGANNIRVCDGHVMNFVSAKYREQHCKGFVVVSGNTYPIKDKLRRLGFRWNGEYKEWRKGIELERECDQIYEELMGCRGVTCEFLSHY